MSVAEHSFFVTFYAMKIGQDLDLSSFDLERLALLALEHDVLEIVSGDIPKPIADKVSEHGDVSDKILEIAGGLFKQVLIGSLAGKIAHDILQMADLLELTIYLVEERRMGNVSIDNLLKVCIEHLDDMAVEQSGHDSCSKWFSDVVHQLKSFVVTKESRRGLINV